MTDYTLASGWGFRRLWRTTDPEEFAGTIADAFRDIHLGRDVGTGDAPERAFWAFEAYLEAATDRMSLILRDPDEDPMDALTGWVARWLEDLTEEERRGLGIESTDDRSTPADAERAGWAVAMRIGRRIRLTDRTTMGDVYGNASMMAQDPVAIQGRTDGVPWVIIHRRLDAGNGIAIWCWYLNLDAEAARAARDALKWPEYESSVTMPFNLPLHKDAVLALGFSMDDSEDGPTNGLMDVVAAIEDQVSLIAEAMGGEE